MADKIQWFSSNTADYVLGDGPPASLLQSNTEHVLLFGRVVEEKMLVHTGFKKKKKLPEKRMIKAKILSFRKICLSIWSHMVVLHSKNRIYLHKNTLGLL